MPTYNYYINSDFEKIKNQDILSLQPQIIELTNYLVEDVYNQDSFWQVLVDANVYDAINIFGIVDFVTQKKIMQFDGVTSLYTICSVVSSVFGDSVEVLSSAGEVTLNIPDGNNTFGIGYYENSNIGNLVYEEDGLLGNLILVENRNESTDFLRYFIPAGVKLTVNIV